MQRTCSLQERRFFDFVLDYVRKFGFERSGKNLDWVEMDEREGYRFVFEGPRKVYVDATRADLLASARGLSDGMRCQLDEAFRPKSGAHRYA